MYRDVPLGATFAKGQLGVTTTPVPAVALDVNYVSMWRCCRRWSRTE